MTINLLILGFTGTLVTALFLFISTHRKRGRLSNSTPPASLSDRQLAQIERRQLREKILEKVSKRGLRGRPML